MGLTGLLVIVALLYFTGAGTWLWNRTLALSGQCYSMAGQLGMPRINGVCNAVGAFIHGTDDFFSHFGARVKSGVKEASFRVKGGNDITSAIGRIKIPGSLEKLRSSAQELSYQGMIGPRGVNPSAPAGERLRNALDNFTIGQQYLANNGSAADKAVPWLQQGADNPGYGLLSQLSLGDMYSQGYGTVSRNPGIARQYYQQASDSITLLQKSTSAEAKQLLATLPDSPRDVQAQLKELIKASK